MNPNPRIAAITARLEVLLLMATEAQLSAALDKVDEVLTAEIAEIVAALKSEEVSDALVSRVENLGIRISGIVQNPVVDPNAGTV